MVKRIETTQAIIDVLKEGPKSISEIAEANDINWRTAENQLTQLEKLGVVMKKEGHSNMFYYKDDNNYYKLYIKQKDKELISAIYSLIKEHCIKKYDKEPTKTHVYKILWKINKKLGLNLPIGWYMYGPCCVQIYTGDEPRSKLDNKTESLVKETTEEYCKFDNIELQRMIYEEEKDPLYILKEELNESKTKEQRDFILMELVKVVPNEAVETTTDFVRATLMLGWEQTRAIFNNLWKYIALIRFKESLEGYYKDSINLYLNKKIESLREEVQIRVTDIVKTYVDAKYSQDEIYQSWKKKYQSA